MSKEKWIELLSKSNHRLESSSNSYSGNSSIRSEFQRDFDRIIFSSSFRRLQNKTQVLPLPKSDYVRNRLTHSLETSSVGRSLENIVGNRILEKYPEIKEKTGISSFDFGYMVSAACLAHDIGNPPFGHAGESAINSYFKSEIAERFINNLTKKQIADLRDYEGNSAGFRILSKTLEAQSQIKGGLRLTLGTYATFTKYPKEVLPNRKDEKKASLKKYGLFQSEVPTYKRIADELGIKSQNNNLNDYAWKRFPLAFLVEASDDICYHIIDFEDGFNVGLIPYELIFQSFTKILDEYGATSYKKKINDILDSRSKITYLRSLVINSLIFNVADIFIENEVDILNGDFDTPLLDSINQNVKELLDKIIDISITKIYNSATVLKIEAAGFKVIPFLLDTFIKAVQTQDKYEGQKHILGLLPKQYKSGINDYEKILNITMFISSMTDRFAVELYKNLNGIELAEY